MIIYFCFNTWNLGKHLPDNYRVPEENKVSPSFSGKKKVFRGGMKTARGPTEDAPLLGTIDKKTGDPNCIPNSEIETEYRRIFGIEPRLGSPHCRY
jgi:hypothetical protein